MNSTVERFEQAEWLGHQLNISVKHKPNNGKLLVFLHGLGCAKEAFDGAFKDPQLSSRFSLLSLDLPGHGKSDKPKDFLYRLGDHASVVKLVIDKFNPESVDVVAHSMGGAIGVLLTRQLRMQGLINVEGNLIASDCGIASRKITEQTESEFAAHGYDEFLANLLQPSEPAMQQWASWYKAAGRAAIYHSASSLVKWSDGGQLLEDFNDLPMNKAFIYGDKSVNSELLPQLRDTTLKPIPNSGHFMMLDNPGEFYKTLNFVL